MAPSFIWGVWLAVSSSPLKSTGSFPPLTSPGGFEDFGGRFDFDTTTFFSKPLPPARPLLLFLTPPGALVPTTTFFSASTGADDRADPAASATVLFGADLFGADLFGASFFGVGFFVLVFSIMGFFVMDFFWDALFGEAEGLAASLRPLGASRVVADLSRVPWAFLDAGFSFFSVLFVAGDFFTGDLFAPGVSFALAPLVAVASFMVVFFVGAVFFMGALFKGAFFVATVFFAVVFFTEAFLAGWVFFTGALFFAAVSFALGFAAVVFFAEGFFAEGSFAGAFFAEVVFFTVVSFVAAVFFTADSQPVGFLVLTVRSSAHPSDPPVSFSALDEILFRFAAVSTFIRVVMCELRTAVPDFIVAVPEVEAEELPQGNGEALASARGAARIDHELAPWRSELAPWRAELAPWRAELAPWRSELAPWRSELAPWRSELAPWRAELAPWGSIFFLPSAMLSSGRISGADQTMMTPSQACLAQ